MHDEEVPQEIVTFAAGNIPFTAVLLVDGSESMRGERLRAALAGARSFAGGMGEFDEAKIVVYSDRLLEITPWQSAGQPPTTGLETLEASGGTAILDHLFVALSMLESRNGRPVVVLLSDGWDFESVAAAEGLRRIVRRSQAVIYWVRLAGDEPGRRGRTLGSPSTASKNEPIRVIGANSWRDADSARDVYQQLEQMVKDSGGRAETLGDTAEIGPAFVDILTEIRQQYALGYYPEPKRQDGSWRKIRVEVPARRLTVRTRAGYLDQPTRP